MYCKNCGKEINPAADFCTSCGVAKGNGNNFCANCGAPSIPNAVVCTSCGCALKATAQTGAKSKMAAGLLAIFLGSLGIHNFYLGYTSKGVIQLVVSILLSWTVVAPTAIWIWAIVEAVKIFQGQIPDAQGNALAD